MEENLKEELNDEDMNELRDKMSRAVLTALQNTIRESGKTICPLDKRFLICTSVSRVVVSLLLAGLPKHLRKEGLGEFMIDAFVLEVYEAAKLCLDQLSHEDSHATGSSSPAALEDLSPIGPVQ